MGTLRVAVDVGGTFTDICILDEDGGEHRGRQGALDAATRSTRSWQESSTAGVDLRDVVALLARNDGRDERAHHPQPAARGDGDDARTSGT